MPLIEVNGFGVEVQKLGIETSSGVAGSHAAGVFLLLTVALEGITGLVTL